MVEGILDLQYFEFEKTNFVKLQGECEFYWNELYTPNEFLTGNVGEPNYFEIPEVWNAYQIDGQNLPRQGYATYRFRILFPTEGRYALKVKEFDCAYKLWVNAQDSVQVGQPGTSKKSTLPNWKRQELYFNTLNQEAEVIIQIANFRHRKGGAEDGIVLGREKDVMKLKLEQVSAGIFLFGVILIIGIFHLVLYVYRRKESSMLVFSLLNFFIALRLLTTGEKLLLDWLPNMPWWLGIRLEYLSYTIAFPLFMYFIYLLNKKEASLLVVKLVAAIGGLVALLILFTPAYIFTHTPLYYQIVIGITACYIFYVLLKALLHKHENSGMLFAGYFFFFIVVINDILHYSKIIDTSFLMPFGLIVMILSQSFVLSKKSSTAFGEVERLSQELDLYSKQLEERVVNRTHKVLKKSRALEKQAQDLLAANTRLKELDKYKQEMMGMIIHDLKNPLNAIINLASEDRTLGNNTQIVRASKLMLNLVSNILDINKYEESELILNLEDTYFSQVLKEAFIEIQPLVRSKNIRLSLQISHDYLLEIDKDLIKRVLINLLINAIKYSEAGSPVVIQAAPTKQSDMLELHVIDKGSGIAKADQKKIFERFVQIAPQDLGDAKSTGIGLTFCKIAIEAHGGRIDVNSKLGKGSDFYFTLPFKAEEQAAHLPIDSLEIDNYTLDRKIKPVLHNTAKTLKQYPIYAISDIEATLNGLSTHKSIAIAHWVKKIKDAVGNCDAALYQKLINQALDE